MEGALFNIRIPGDQYEDDRPLADNSIFGSRPSVDVHFRELRGRLVDHIEKSSFVVGAVAWLTDEAILRAMAGLRGASIIVQKEDFLRPDINVAGDWKSKLRRLYDAVGGNYGHGFNVRYVHEVLECMSTSGDPGVGGVRCVGNYNREKKPAFPRMHNKFLVFCDYAEGDGPSWGDGKVVPHTVWTGSFNFTNNAAKSFENALVIRDLDVAGAYYREWAQIAALSEPLDWEEDWCAPEWRIGT